jgi:ribose transport system permease protein
MTRTANVADHAPTAAVDEPTPAQDAAARRVRARRARLGGLAIPGILVAEIILFSIISTDFATSTNFRLLISGQATVVFLGIAATIPLRAGDFDLSIAAVMLFSACTVPLLAAHGWPLGLACLVALVFGMAVGAINSLLIVKLELDGLIVTLGVFTVLGGVTQKISNNSFVSGVPSALREFSSHTLLGLPMPVWIGWLLVLLTWYVFEYTSAGRHLLFIGGNRSAAFMAGVKVTRLRVTALIVCSTVAALAGIFLAGTLGTIDPSSGSSYLLPPFTAAFLGASVLQVGRFNAIGTLVGVYLIAVGVDGLQLLGVFGWVTDVFQGAALLVAVVLARLLRPADRSVAH